MPTIDLVFFPPGPCRKGAPGAEMGVRQRPLVLLSSPGPAGGRAYAAIPSRRRPRGGRTRPVHAARTRCPGPFSRLGELRPREGSGDGGSTWPRQPLASHPSSVHRYNPPPPRPHVCTSSTRRQTCARQRPRIPRRLLRMGVGESFPSLGPNIVVRDSKTRRAAWTP